MPEEYQYSSEALNSAVDPALPSIESQINGDITQRSIQFEVASNGVIAHESIYHSTRGHGSKRWVFRNSSELLEFVSDWALEVLPPDSL